MYWIVGWSKQSTEFSTGWKSSKGCSCFCLFVSMLTDTGRSFPSVRWRLWKSLILKGWLWDVRPVWQLSLARMLFPEMDLSALRHSPTFQYLLWEEVMKVTWFGRPDPWPSGWLNRIHTPGFSFRKCFSVLSDFAQKISSLQWGRGYENCDSGGLSSGPLAWPGSKQVQGCNS
jgi:hypothetical protein